MNYKLVKQLKNAGFPQQPDKSDWYIDSANDKAQKKDIELLLYDSVYLPPLSELIEACGDGFDSLVNNGLLSEDDMGNVKVQWEAVTFDLGIGRVEGKTPEIAVAKLWLKLNK